MTMILTVEMFLALLCFGALCFSSGYNLGKSEHKK